jgi:hypothetical protein
MVLSVCHLPANTGSVEAKSLLQEFAVKDLGQLHHFLGVTVEPRQTGLLLHQR